MISRYLQASTRGALLAAGSHRRDRPGGLARRCPHRVRLPLSAAHVPGGHGVAALADSRHGGGLHGARGSFRRLPLYVERHGAPGHPGFRGAGGRRAVRFEIAASRRRERLHLRRGGAGIRPARKAAEEQLEFLIDSSPAAILTMDADCADSARQCRPPIVCLGVAAGELPGRSIHRYIPGPGARAFHRERRGRHSARKCSAAANARTGEVFLANVFFSTYQTAMGPRLAALVVDASEELREREESSLEQMLAGSRILVGAVSHEIRNVCGAIAVIYENLARAGALTGQQGFRSAGFAGGNAQQDRLAGTAPERRRFARRAASICGEILDDLRSCWSLIARRPILPCTGTSRGTAAGLGGSPQPVAGAFEPGQEQRAGPGGRRPEANGYRGVGRARRGVDPGHRFRPGHRLRREAVPALSEGRRIHRPRACIFRALSCDRFAAICATIPRFPAVPL